jgi:hypothetical protein
MHAFSSCISLHLLSWACQFRTCARRLESGRMSLYIPRRDWLRLTLYFGECMHYFLGPDEHFRGARASVHATPQRLARFLRIRSERRGSGRSTDHRISRLTAASNIRILSQNASASAFVENISTTSRPLRTASVPAFASAKPYPVAARIAFVRGILAITGPPCVHPSITRSTSRNRVAWSRSLVRPRVVTLPKSRLCTRNPPIEEAILRPVWPHSSEPRRIRLADRTRDWRGLSGP